MGNNMSQISEIAPHVASIAARGSQIFSNPPAGAGAGIANPAAGLGEGVSFSPEASMMMQKPDETQDKAKSEKLKEIEKKKEDALAQIDMKVMQLLSTLKTRKDYSQTYKPILIEDFQKAKEDSSRLKTSEVGPAPMDRNGKKKESGFNDPSYLVLTIMAKDSRLPKEVQAGFGEISREYAQVLRNAQDEMNALENGAKNNAIANNFLGMMPGLTAPQPA